MTLKSPRHSLQAYRRRHDQLYGGRSYVSKVLATGPIAYWPLWESSGTVAACLVNSAQNGTYSSDVSTWPVGTGIGDGNTAPRFDGANDYINLSSATLQAAMNGAEGTISIWCQVAAAGVWTDGAQRFAFWALNSATWQDMFYIDKQNINNRIRWYYMAGTVIESVFNAAMTTTAWFHMAMTWSAAADEFRAYLNGTQEGMTQVGLGVWAGSTDEVIVGANTVVPNNPWQGGLGHVAWWDRALAPAKIASLAVI